MNIDALREKYKHHEYMKQKVEDYIANLPVLMASLEEEYDKKQQKKQALLEKREECIPFFIFRKQKCLYNIRWTIKWYMKIPFYI